MADRARPIGLCAAVCLLALPLSLLPTTEARSEEEVLGAAIRLKQAHVERFWVACQQRGGSEASCRADLRALHARETKALARIGVHLSETNSEGLNRALTDCYSPGNTYADLIACWEELADHLARGEGSPPRSVKSQNSSWDEAVSEIAALDPAERRSVVLCIRGSVTVNFDKTVKQNLSKGGGDALWAVKVYSRASA